MKINITKKDYRALVEILFVADWFVDAHTIGDENKQHASVREVLLSHYKEMGVDDVIEYSGRMKEHFPTRNFEEHLHDKYIDKYNEEFFWDELIDKLAERDVIQAIGIKEYQKLDGIVRITMVDDEKEKYQVEFEQHGLKHVKIEHMGSN